MLWFKKQNAYWNENYNHSKTNLEIEVDTIIGVWVSRNLPSLTFLHSEWV